VRAVLVGKLQPRSCFAFLPIQKKVRAKLCTFHENINGTAVSLKPTNCRGVYRFDSMKLQGKLLFVLDVQKTQLRWDYGNPT
jgi:hypothetical protein